MLRDSSPDTAARALLGGVLSHGAVAVRILEVEAYGGPPGSPFPDAAAHTWPGPTARNQVMFGDAGHLYVYLSHGIHQCVNITCRPAGEGGGVLLRAARIADGHEIVGTRRPGVVAERAARGPGNLGRTLGIDLSMRGIDVLDPSSSVHFRPEPVPGARIRSGPRVGVSREADRPWRFWVAGAREVSTYRRSPRAPQVTRPVVARHADGGQ
ncbi:DNA-3-methyladenine glycosylase [Dietzia sp. B32]|uniref:DNA-3-methyladenine glycosylase n=1 Tax=Dietzia sp. B32 TaxID=2915130 RepID=UPI0021ADF384|nr:DNA-3-methyladenine glycosylase [Dietzia sp. B32]UVE97063.1 DNA-3-methyladenine glycosylase [Dietzia sp. B32]